MSDELYETKMCLIQAGKRINQLEAENEIMITRSNYGDFLDAIQDMIIKAVQKALENKK